VSVLWILGHFPESKAAELSLGPAFKVYVTLPPCVQYTCRGWC